MWFNYEGGCGLAMSGRDEVLESGCGLAMTGIDLQELKLHPLKISSLSDLAELLVRLTR